MRPLSAREIIAAFDPIDRPSVVPPPLADVAWADMDFLSWRHPDGGYGYLCVQLPERDVGLVLRTLDGGRSTRAGVCDLCLGSDRECGTTMVLVESWGEPRTSLGLHVCRDLDCSAGVRGRKWHDTMGETIPTGRRIERLQANVERFVRRVTGL